MKKIFDILSRHKYAIIWTICYVLVMKFILTSLFNFDIFSATAWIRLAHSHLHGFGGMVFGIMILSALPMYIATTSIIVRTKKPLFSIPIPNFIVRAFAPPPPPEPDNGDTTEEPTAEQKPETFPAEMPTELHAAFIRARHNGSIRQAISAFDSARISADIPQIQPVEQPDFTDESDFPLPPDFDTPDPAADDTISMPNFTDINFDNVPEPQPMPPITPDTTTAIQQLGSDARADGDFIIYKGNLIAVHSDPDFWIADDTDWFASGKQRPSPIAAVLARAAELSLRPVLYLAETNILDLDARIVAWESSGVHIIKDISDLDA